MESFIYETAPEEPKGGNIMGKNVLIATMYTADPIMMAATKLSPDRMYLIMNEKPNKEQEAALKLIKDSLGKVIDIKEIKADVYDIVKIAERCVTLINDQPKEDQIFVSITGSRKTAAIGLLFAAYACCSKVKKIAYFPEEENMPVVYLPKMCFSLSDSERKVLDYINADDYKNISELAKKIDISTGMLYRAIDSLKKNDFLIDDEKGLRLTDAGKIARL